MHAVSVITSLSKAGPDLSYLWRPLLMVGPVTEQPVIGMYFPRRYPVEGPRLARAGGVDASHAAAILGGAVDL